MITHSQKVSSFSIGVRMSIRPAGPFEKTTPIITRSTMEKTLMMVSMAGPRYFPVSSDTLRPLFLMDIMPAM